MLRSDTVLINKKLVKFLWLPESLNRLEHPVLFQLHLAFDNIRQANCKALFGGQPDQHWKTGRKLGLKREK